MTNDQAFGAEPLLRECLSIREKALKKGDWLITYARSKLGESLAKQSKFTEAEPLLIESANALQENQNAPESRKIFVDTFPDPGGGVQVSMKGGFSPAWSPDGKKLYFGRRPSGERKWAVMVVEFSDSDPPAPLPPKVLFNPGPFWEFDVAPDGQRFLLRIVPDETPDNHVILNWMNLLDREGSE